MHGLRPSLGRIPAHNFSGPDRFIGAQLTAVSGPIARSIGDLRLALNAMSQPDIRDHWHVEMPLTGVDVPKRLAICISPDGLMVDRQIKIHLQQAAGKIAAAGWQVEEVSLPPIRVAMENQLMLWMAEMEQDASGALAREQDPDAILVHSRLVARCPNSSLDNIMEVLQTRATLTRQWQEFLQTYPVVLCPVSGQLPFKDLLDLQTQTDFDEIIEAQMLQIGLPFMGLPCLAVATGQAGDRPVGVQLVASHFREGLLLDIGEIIGKTIPVVTPEF